jgi:hypothetical protein
MHILYHKSTSDGGALIGMFGKDEELWLSMVTRWRIVMACAQFKVVDIRCL